MAIQIPDIEIDKNKLVQLIMKEYGITDVEAWQKLNKKFIPADEVFTLMNQPRTLSGNARRELPH